MFDVRGIIMSTPDTQHTTAHRITGLSFDQVKFAGIQPKSMGTSFLHTLPSCEVQDDRVFA